MPRPQFRRRLTCTAIALALGLGATPVVFAQSTTGSLFGQVPASGESIHVESASGVSRDLSIDENGRYRSPGLPVGDYTVTLMRDGAAVETRTVQVKVGTATEVSFASAASGKATTLDAVKVSASAMPSIDTSATDSRTVITSEQLARLPLARNAEDIAKLAPGVVGNSGGFKSDTGKDLVSFSGSSPTENAYYINGFNTTDPLNTAGGLTLPYGAIDQQETYTGGYSAQFGRSDGGVINAIGKHGTNTWHYGAQLLWEPDWGRATAKNSRYGNGLPDSPLAGDLYQYNGASSTDSYTASLYAGGPIIKDKLFFFAAAELQRTWGDHTNTLDSGGNYVSYANKMPRAYAKLNWNITDNHIIELTGVLDELKSNSNVYAYDYGNDTRGPLSYVNGQAETGGHMWTARYTGYLTDALTLTANYGEMRTKMYQAEPAGYDDSLVRIDNWIYQNPALNGGSPIYNNQVQNDISEPDRGNHSSNLRIDLTWVLGKHTLSAGLDNIRSQAIDQGGHAPGPGYVWTYQRADDPSLPLDASHGIGPVAGFPNGADGYYVQKSTWSGITSISSSQRAQYIEDKWQVADTLLLSLGLRNDQFTNYNSDGIAYIRQTKPQWAPRIGAAWDVHGDASFKVYANAGRYYLGLPLNPGLIVAAGFYNTTQLFTYSGIATDGSPTGLTQVSNEYSALNQFGQAPDPKTASARNLEPEYQDEYILGFEKTLGEAWTWGLKGMYRNLRNAIDDFCSMGQVVAAANAAGHDVQNYNTCYLINPGRTNVFTLVDGDGSYFDFPMSNADLGFKQKLIRKYYSLEAVLEHPMRDNWYAKASYVFSRSYGNTEGQVRSDASQSGTSTSYDWDNWTIMENANGPQNNDHTHQVKLYGYYQITPEWLVSGNFAAISGTPRHCLSYYGNASEQLDPLGYGSVYHFCNGQASPPGKQGRMPWMTQLDMGVTWSPAFAEHRLNFTASMLNVLDRQVPLQRYAFAMNTPSADASPNSPLFQTVTIRQSPRSLRLSVSYDF